MSKVIAAEGSTLFLTWSIAFTCAQSLWPSYVQPNDNSILFAMYECLDVWMIRFMKYFDVTEILQ
jgi:hypothetical protein